MTRAELLARLRESQASAETICNVMHVWQDEQPIVCEFDVLLQAIVSACFIQKREFFSKCRKRPYVIARQLFSWYAVKKAGHTLKDVGVFLKKNHTTIVHSHQKISDLLSVEDPQVTLYYNNLQRELAGNPDGAKEEEPKITRVLREPDFIKYYYDRRDGVAYRTLAEVASALKVKRHFKLIRKRFGTRIQKIIEAVPK